MPIFIGLVDTLGREPRAAEYRRQTIVLEEHPQSASFVNQNEIVFATSQQSWGAIDHLRLFDNSGEELCTIQLDTPRHVVPDTSVYLRRHSVAILAQSDLWDHLEAEIAFDERQMCLPDVQETLPHVPKKRDPDLWDMILSDDQVV